MAAWSSASTSCFHKGLFFFYQGLSSAFDFFLSKEFSINKKFARVNLLCARCKLNMQINEPQDEQKIPSGDASDTFLIYQLITQSTFFKITRVLFCWILNLFLLETLGRIFEVCLVK